MEDSRIERIFHARAESEGIGYGAVKEKILNNVSMKRMVSADNVAEMAVFLCSAAGENISS